MDKELKLVNIKLNKKINNLRRSKLRLKNLLNNKIIELEKQIEDLKWETSWNNIETIDTSNIMNSLDELNSPTKSENNI
jgi:hypothetical protein